MSIAVLGAGGVGGLLAAVLARTGEDVTVVAREETAEAIGRLGIAVESPRFGSLHAWPRACEQVPASAATLVVAVKAPDLDAALDRVGVTPQVVVPLLNGVEHMAVLRDLLPGAHVVAATIRVQAHRAGIAHVVHRAPFVTVTMAPPGAPEVEAALSRAGVDVERGASEAGVLWGKLSRLAGLALATAASGAPLGDVRDDARAVAAEVAAVARAEGAAVETATVLAELDALPDAASSSLAADIAAGRPSELDAIAGAVLRAADRHAIDCPATTTLTASLTK